jgi:hypothetical protein
MVIPVPTLSAAGWVTSPAEKADMLFSHFYESDKFQTYLYGKNITNLQWLVEQYGHDITILTQQMRASLEVYLTRYYPEGVAINVTSSDDETLSAAGKIELRLYCTVNEGGRVYSFGRLIQATNSKIDQIVKLNN